MSEAQALLETCFSYYENPKRRYSAVDELPDEILPSESKHQFFPFRLLVLSNSIKIMTGNMEGVSNLMQLLDLLWKRMKKEEMNHAWWDSCNEIPEDEVRIIVSVMMIDYSSYYSNRRYSYEYIIITR